MVIENGTPVVGVVAEDGELEVRDDGVCGSWGGGNGGGGVGGGGGELVDGDAGDGEVGFGRAVDKVEDEGDDAAEDEDCEDCATQETTHA